MDKLSFKILEYISLHGDTEYADIIRDFGEKAKLSLSHLYGEGYTTTEKFPAGIGMNGQLTMRSTGIYSITSKGVAYIESNPGRTFDRWLTRILAIWGAITGTIALLLELWPHFPK